MFLSVRVNIPEMYTWIYSSDAIVFGLKARNGAFFCFLVAHLVHSIALSIFIVKLCIDLFTLLSWYYLFTLVLPVFLCFSRNLDERASIVSMMLPQIFYECLLGKGFLVTLCCIRVERCSGRSRTIGFSCDRVHQDRKFIVSSSLWWRNLRIICVCQTVVRDILAQISRYQLRHVNSIYVL